MQNRFKLALIVLIVVVAGLYFYVPPKESVSCKECNIIIVGFDALQAAHVHHLGYKRDTTPTLDALAARGFSFSQAISPASWTVPGFMSVLTGAYPSVHRVVNKFSVFTKSEQKLSNLKELSPDIQTFAEVMKDAGYATGGFTGDAGVLGKFGYNQGFDIYTDKEKFGSMANSDTHALAWLDALPAEQKFFMFFHGYDAHGQFNLPAGYASRYVPTNYAGSYQGTAKEQEALREEGLAKGSISLTPEDVEFWRAWYDGKIRDADERLGEFLGELDKRELLNNTVIVVVSDHGTEFYEHRRFDHGFTLYDELVRVPLIVVVPGARGGKVIEGQVTTLDVVPTLLDVLDVTPNVNFEKQIAGRRNLVPYLEDTGRAGYDVFTETDYRNYTHKHSVRSADGWKYILTLESGAEELYDLSSDPGETKNLIAQETAKAAQLRQVLRTHMRKDLGSDLGAPLRSDCIPVYEGQCLYIEHVRDRNSNMVLLKEEGLDR